MFIPGLPVHVVQRGNNRQAIFFEQEDYLVYLSFIAEAIDRYGCYIHAYVLMTNHVHLLMTPLNHDAVSRSLQYTGRHYVPYVNNKLGRTGTLWEGRFKASIIDSDEYLLACYRYIEMNPVRAGMVTHPGSYQWSSHACNAFAREDSLVTPHANYLSLGATAKKRAQNYRRLFEAQDDEGELEEIRLHTQSGTPLGNQRFRYQIETSLGVRAGQVSRGRPEKGI
ncbi:transposase [Haliea sp. E17]|uniref:transposase n=1 Tax=Haliea sp. E17 TaxID=3401576 RepID=UPI003AAE599F